MCNFCSLKRYRKIAKEKNKKLTILADAQWGMGGVNIYIHPVGLKIEKLGRDENGKRAEYCYAWFMSIPKNCCC